PYQRLRLSPRPRRRCRRGPARPRRRSPRRSAGTTADPPVRGAGRGPEGGAYLAASSVQAPGRPAAARLAPECKAVALVGNRSVPDRLPARSRCGPPSSLSDTEGKRDGSGGSSGGSGGPAAGGGTGQRARCPGCGVAYVQQDARVALSGAQPHPPSWGLDRIDQRGLPLGGWYMYPDVPTATVHAYVIDTGLRTTHVEFGGRASNGWDFIDNDPVADDCNGHGTHVAGTIGGATFGVAKSVQLVGVRVLDCSGSGSYSQIIAGIDWVTANAVKPAVANLSLGGPADRALDDAVRASIASGVTYVVAA